MRANYPCPSSVGVAVVSQHRKHDRKALGNFGKSRRPRRIYHGTRNVRARRNRQPLSPTLASIGPAAMGRFTRRLSRQGGSSVLPVRAVIGRSSPVLRRHESERDRRGADRHRDDGCDQRHRRGRRAGAPAGVMVTLSGLSLLTTEMALTSRACQARATSSPCWRQRSRTRNHGHYPGSKRALDVHSSQGSLTRHPRSSTGCITSAW